MQKKWKSFYIVYFQRVILVLIILYKMWDQIIYPFPNFNGCTVDVWESEFKVISSHMLFSHMWLHIHVEIELIHVN